MMIKSPSPPFIRGFLVTAAVLLMLNLASYILFRARMPGEDSQIHLWSGTAGFPLPFYEYSTGSYIGFVGFVREGVVLDYLFVWGAAIAVGACCHALSRKIRQGSFSRQAISSAWKALQGQQE